MSASVSNTIVTDNLILYVDSANPSSYSSGSGIWDSMGFGENFFTLNNGPTFSNDYAGILTFDGTDDNLSNSQLFNPSIRNGNRPGETPDIDFELTFEIVFRVLEELNGTMGQISIFRTNATSFQVPPACLYRVSVTPVNGLVTTVGYTTTIGGTQSLTTTNIYNLNEWYHVVLSLRKTSTTTGEWFFMRNGIILEQQTLNNISWWQNYSSTLTTQGNLISASSVLNHDRAIMRLYRKGLTQQEALQNYNATKKRFKL